MRNDYQNDQEEDGDDKTHQSCQCPDPDLVLPDITYTGDIVCGATSPLSSRIVSILIT